MFNKHSVTGLIREFGGTKESMANSLLNQSHRVSLKIQVCPHSASGADRTGRNKAETGFPGVWALGEPEEKPCVGGLAAKIKEDDSSLQRDLPKETVSWICSEAARYFYTWNTRLHIPHGPLRDLE